jgi:large repetitive protein
VSFRRLLFVFVLALAAAVVFVPGASAGSIDDGDPCPKSGVDLVCPIGTVGVPYSIRFHGDEEPICSPGDDKWYINGSEPPGLTLSEDGTLSGTPTQAGGFTFWLELKLPQTETCSAHDSSEERVVVPINPGTPVAPPLPRLIIGPESVSPGTVGTPYMAAMTANLQDSKTWAIVAGALPTGLTLGASDGVINGMPAVSGSFPFTVQAQIGDGRSDTKSLTLEVRNRLTLTRTGDLSARIVRTEVGVDFDGAVFAAGGFGTYLWSVDGELPPGLTLAEDGTITGSPEEPGSYRFTVAVTDAESRRAAYAARMVVAKRLAIKSRLLKPGKVGRFLSRKVATFGGIGPMTTRVKRGPLPRGIFFDRLAGIFVGAPTKSGTWKIRVQIVDALGVKATGIVVLIVRK